MTQEEMWKAVKNNDERYDGIFFYAVKSTGIYCRPSCKSKLPKRENICFFNTSHEARLAGFRPCKRCRSDLLNYQPMKDIGQKIKKLIDSTFQVKMDINDELKSIGLTLHRINEIFKAQYQVSVSEYLNNLKLEEAKKRLIHTDDKVIDIAYLVGFQSVSGFYRFFKENTGYSPARYRKEKKINNV
ncbi:bifunctional transcriptional activator/DNA repair enzyme AdaA [Clostridium brassicae]|uniref:Helix-turn-helix domain-containing protein n=1 Tax=Clostridium brassicae TaxID=2999072 RepID=A0ABT4D7X9_9CLOT|nr:Ada metal-binding domain-containing protein [Clostridium brassicae]MCY6958391.1 helix-turn-helix domain-containing protein [Clostridium brassicae]